MTPVAPIRFAFIGTNWITSALVDAGRTVSGFEVAAVMSRSQESASKFAARHNATATHTSLESLANDANVDAVYIASPNSLHAEQSIAMLEAGKHVLCEKPLAADVHQAQAMFTAAGQAERLLMEAYLTPFLPNFAAILEALPLVGRVRRAVLIKDQYSSRYDLLKAGQLPNAFNPAMAAGSLVDLGIYAIAPAIHLFGPPSSVTATAIMLPTGVDGQGSVLMGYDGFEVVAMHSKIAASGTYNAIEGELGTILFNDPAVPTRVEFIDRAGARTDLSRPQSEHHMRYEVAHFINEIRQGSAVSGVQTPQRSQQVLAVLDEARRQTGVRFPTDQ